ncbi:FliM/FliN family flagellar motor switch protein [Amaricoccus sp.]|uniref:FliM/FliN family flagellar motor switch protein n=1 Tax=Amaricoccus sp. TaxID=1872485 RepID=UPI001B4C5DAE|nr:FliM/FliN family flagellar motor switch protein [Amaricoccus sp.]MBP7003302.1 FliM/FliN family flagellar motor switch protein [Amaricoccus sp.]
MSPAAAVLSKKLRQGGVARSPLPDTDVVAETLARAVEDRLRPLVKTTLVAEVAAPRVTRLADATGAVSSPALLGVVEVEDADIPALIAIHADLAWHLVDLTLGGDPLAAPAPLARGLTAIDMALGRLHVDAVLAAFGATIGAALGRPMPKEMRIRDQRQQVAQLRLAPDYIDVLVIRLTLTLAEAGRRGTCDLVLPLSTLDVIRASIEARASQAARERPNDLWKTLMRRAAAAAPVPVDAVLHRQSLSLAALQDLKVGQTIEIPRQAAETIELTIPQPGGRSALVAAGRLGAFQGRKVVKLETPVDPRLVQHVGRALRPAPPAPDAPEALPAEAGAA